MPSVLSRLMPRERSFFSLFTEMTANIEQGAQALADLFHDYRDVQVRAEHIKELEHKGDQLTHQVITRLNQTFVTPFDREDIHALSTKLDDVLDLVDAVATRLVIYNADKPRSGASELADVLVRATHEVHMAVGKLERPNGILEHCIEINSLENRGDDAVRRAIAKLFKEEKDPVEIIKWKEILEVLETATDKCEDVANILESVVLKNA